MKKSYVLYKIYNKNFLKKLTINYTVMSDPVCTIVVFYMAIICDSNIWVMSTLWPHLLAESCETLSAFYYYFDKSFI